MKWIAYLVKITTVIVLCCVIVFSCKKNSTPADPGNPPPPGGQGGSTNADTLSNHLQFMFSTKIQGKIPDASPGSSLKISVKDTLYLLDEVLLPIKFLYEDENENVGGAFIQVQPASIGGSFSSYYYDVPEVPEMKDDDSVSVIMVGIDPAGLEVPTTFIIDIIPHTSSGEPLAHIVRPVKIVPHTVDPAGAAGTCGLVLPDGDSWVWEMSYIFASNPSADHYFDFFSSPDTEFGAKGQNIRGNCCNGTSVYGFCSPGDTTLNSSLHFSTFYQIQHESFVFFDNNTFFRQTFEETPIPLPDESDFCAGGEGLVKPNLNHTIYNGNYTVTPVTLPIDLKGYDDSLRLSLQGTGTTTGGFGNPGGIIHQLDCKIGSLVLIQLDNEGGGQHLYKFYLHVVEGGELWFDL